MPYRRSSQPCLLGRTVLRSRPFKGHTDPSKARPECAAPLFRIATRRRAPVPTRDKTPALAETAHRERCRPALTCTCNGRDGKDVAHRYPRSLPLDHSAPHASPTAA